MNVFLKSLFTAVVVVVASFGMFSLMQTVIAEPFFAGIAAVVAMVLPLTILQLAGNFQMDFLHRRFDHIATALVAAFAMMAYHHAGGENFLAFVVIFFLATMFFAFAYLSCQSGRWADEVRTEKAEQEKQDITMLEKIAANDKRLVLDLTPYLEAVDRLEKRPSPEASAILFKLARQRVLKQATVESQ